MEGVSFSQKRCSLPKYKKLVRQHTEGSMLFDLGTNVVIEINAVFGRMLGYANEKEFRKRILKHDMTSLLLPEAQSNGDVTMERLDRMERDVYRSQVASVRAVLGFLGADSTIIDFNVWLTFVWMKSKPRGLLGLFIARPVDPNARDAQEAAPIPRASHIFQKRSDHMAGGGGDEKAPVVVRQSTKEQQASAAAPAGAEVEPATPDPQNATAEAVGVGKRDESDEQGALAESYHFTHTRTNQTPTATLQAPANPSQPGGEGETRSKSGEHLARLTLNVENVFQLSAVKDDKPAEVKRIGLIADSGGVQAAGVKTGGEVSPGGQPPGGGSKDAGKEKVKQEPVSEGNQPPLKE